MIFILKFAILLKFAIFPNLVKIDIFNEKQKQT